MSVVLCYNKNAYEIDNICDDVGVVDSYEKWIWSKLPCASYFWKN